MTAPSVAERAGAAEEIRGIFFDLGGTLFSYRNIRQATGPLLLEAVRRLNIRAPLENIGRAYQQASRTVSQDYADKDYYLHRDMFRETFARFVANMEARFDEGVYDWYQQRQHQAVISHLKLKENCIETLAHLRARGLYLSIVSNIDDDMLEPLVARESLDRYLHHWTSSEAAASCKPHRRFFEVSLEKSGLSPAQVLFVGDSPEHDVHGASRLGMRTALIVEDGIEPPLQSGRQTPDPDHVIRRLAELKHLV